MTTTGSDGSRGLDAARRAGEAQPAGPALDLEDLPRAELDESSSDVVRDVRGER